MYIILQTERKKNVTLVGLLIVFLKYIRAKMFNIAFFIKIVYIL